MKFWIEIKDSAGNKYGDGPIRTATNWQTVARLDRAGSFSFSMPASDPRAGLVQPKRQAWCYGLVAGAVMLLGAGIIDEISTTVGQPTMLTVSGDDLLRELTYRSVGFLEITDGAGNGSLTAVADIMAEAPGGWSLDTVNGYSGTTSEVYAGFAGELALAALGKVAEHSGEHFRLGEGKQVVWLRDDITASGVRAIGRADAVAVESNPDVCLITSLERTAGSYDLITRVFAFGAGQGRARVTLADATVSPHTGYVIDASHPKGANLTASGPQTTYGVIERFLSWKEISPVTNTEADIESAGNALYAAAYQYLSKYSRENESYRLRVTKLDRPLYPGQTIRVIWREVVDGYTSVDIDADLTVLETTTHIDQNGVRTVGLQVSTIDAWPLTFEEIIAGQLEEARLMDGHPQTFAGYYSEGLGNFNISPAYSAVGRFKFDDRVTRLVSAALRFRTDAFETTATAAASGGGSSPTSEYGGGTTKTSGSGTSHKHSLVIHKTLDTSFQPIRWNHWNNEIAILGTGGNVYDETQDTESSHTHDVEIPAHRHLVTIDPHEHPLTYGIHRSGTYPGGVTIWVDGVNRTFALTGQTSIGTTTGSTGIVEVEIADLINADFRKEHTIELKCSSGQGRILNVALRCFVIVQAIVALPAGGGTVDPGTPAAPTVSVAGTAAGWRVSWLAVSGAESYRIYGNTTGSDTGAEEISLTTSTEILVPYSAGYSWFAGTGIAGTNESDIGTWATDASAPDEPTWTSHVYQTDGHLLSWYHPDQAMVENFVLYRNSVGSVNGSEAQIATLAGTALNYLAAFAATGDYFGIKAVSYAGNSSNVVWCGPYDPTPATPASVSVEMSEVGGLVMSWAAVAAARWYEVQAAEDAGGTNATDVWSGLALVTPTLRNGSLVYLRVRAVGWDDSASDWSSWLTDSNGPDTPSINRIIEDWTQVTIYMSPGDTSHTSVGFSHYVVEVADDSSGTNSTTIDAAAPYAPTLSYPLTETGSLKYYRLTAVDVAGNESAGAWIASVVDYIRTVQDMFDEYGGDAVSDLESLWWLNISSVESDEDWFLSSGVFSTSIIITGAESLKQEFTGALGGSVLTFPSVLDLSNDNRFTNNDFILFTTYTTDESNLTLVRITIGEDNSNYFYKDVNVTNGYNFHKILVSDFQTAYGSPSWDNIQKMRVYGYGSYPYPFVYFDDFRIVKADPDDATDYNDTGRAWDKAAETGSDAGEWHVYAGQRTGEPGKPYSYGQIKTAGSPSQWYLSHKPLADTNIVSGTVEAGVYLKDDDGAAGLSFFVKSVDADSWEMYAVEVDTSADTVSLVKWVAGTRTVITSATFTCAANQIVWLGADFRDYSSGGGRLKVYASLVEGNLIQATNLVISTQDTSLTAGGSVGLLSKQANVRFVNFVAGSPAHAETADVARALDGPILAGASKRVRYNSGSDQFEWSMDGETWTEVRGEMAAADILAALLTVDGTGSGLTAEYLATLGSYVWTDATASPRDFPVGVSTSFVRGAHGWPSYGTVLTVRGLSAGQDGSVFQLYVPYNSTYGGDYARYRMGLYNNAGWTGWKSLGYGGGIWKYLNYDYTLGNTNLIIPFNATYYDTTPDVTWSNYRFTINTAGTYTLHLHLRPQYTRTQSPYSWIRINGGGAIASAWYNLYDLGEGTEATLDVSCTIEAAVGDYFEALANGQDPWNGNYFRLRASSVGPPLDMQHTSFSIHRVA